MSKVYFSGRELSLGENMALWRSQLTFGERRKRKFGIREYTVCQIIPAQKEIQKK